MNEQLFITLRELDQLATMAVENTTDSVSWPCFLIKILIPCKENGCECSCCPMGVWKDRYFRNLIKVFPNESSTNDYPYGYKKSN